MSNILVGIRWIVWLAVAIAVVGVPGTGSIEAGDLEVHWAFQPPRRHAVPGSAGSTPIDRFVRARLASRHLAPSPAAPDAVQVRRVTLDLIGLLPDAARVEAYLGDSRPDRWERLVDELLASPHFGERWGRHWLDLARFADSSGYESDTPRQIWPYRDWVIEAFNSDMGFERFVTEQLAGDLLPAADVSQRIATGFQCNVIYDPGVRYEAIVDQVQTVGSVFLGLTLGCAQCHAHKTDPVSHEEFYRLYAFFNETSIERLPLPGFDTGYRDGLVIRDKQNKTDRPRGPATLMLKSAPQATHVFENGDPAQPGQKVVTGFPEFLGMARGSDDGTSVPDRIDLARWILSDQNPLTDRVTVNRIWQRLFGAGLVVTENDFGVQTPPPSHPGLLDHLSLEFRHHGRRFKPLIRSIVLSATYRQSSDVRPELAAVDVRNRLVGRQRRLRLEAEVIRDISLQAGGVLSEKMLGPSVFPDQPPGVLDARATAAVWTPSEGQDRWRRGLYTWHWRLTPHPLKPLFDAPEGVTSCTRRDRSNVPVQALALLNDASFYTAARGLGRWSWQHGRESAVRVDNTVLRCLCRRPSPVERRVLLELLDSQRATLKSDPAACLAILGLDSGEAGEADDDLLERATWVLVARVILNLDEFFTRE